NQRNWLKIVDALGAPELASDPRFAHNPERMANLKELEAELGKRFRLKPAAHWLAVLDELGVPAGPVNDMLQALSDPQTIAREMVVELEHPTAGPVKAIGFPVKFSETPGKVRKAAPVFGEDTAEILAEYGFSADEIAALEKEGAVVAHHPEIDRQKVA
ncbi:MAG: CoA transferase, partial [Microvirga sp.]